MPQKRVHSRVQNRSLSVVYLYSSPWWVKWEKYLAVVTGNYFPVLRSGEPRRCTTYNGRAEASLYQTIQFSLFHQQYTVTTEEFYCNIERRFNSNYLYFTHPRKRLACMYLNNCCTTKRRFAIITTLSRWVDKHRRKLWFDPWKHISSRLNSYILNVALNRSVFFRPILFQILK